ncbi:MAG: MFS transporter [Chloroflexota bacterium]|nr:MFS transporter [Chloroflexota bacterium]
MVGADIRRFSRDQRGAVATYITGITYGALQMLAGVFLHPTLIVSLFLSSLTSSYITIGLIVGSGTVAWFLPQWTIAPLLSGRRRLLPWAVSASIVRAAALILLAYVTYRGDRLSDAQLLRSFFILYIAYSIAAGLSAAFMEGILIRGIPEDRRTRFYHQRTFWAGLAALAGALVIRRVFDTGPTFPRNFTLLFAAAAAALIAATFFSARLHEPIRGALSATSPRRLIRELSLTVGAPEPRRFFAFRWVLAVSTLAEPFYIIYAIRVLDVPISMAGVYVLVFLGARLFSTPVWNHVVGLQGPRTTLQYAALLRLVTPLVAILLPFLFETSIYRERVDASATASYLFALVFILSGLAQAGLDTGGFRYLNDVVSPQARATTVGVANVGLAIAAFSPLLGGFLIGRFDFERAFLGAGLAAFLAVLLSGALRDAHIRPRRAANWRLGRARI